ncbi:MAG: hypothetical protein ACI9C1_000950, partial [Candidatus Aldehydirespiratoraceae bacterium]
RHDPSAGQGPWSAGVSAVPIVPGPNGALSNTATRTERAPQNPARFDFTAQSVSAAARRLMRSGDVETLNWLACDPRDEVEVLVKVQDSEFCKLGSGRYD